MEVEKEENLKNNQGNDGNNEDHLKLKKCPQKKRDEIEGSKDGSKKLE